MRSLFATKRCVAQIFVLAAITSFSSGKQAVADDVRISITPRMWYSFSGSSTFVPCDSNAECKSLEDLTNGPVEILVTSETNPSPVIAGTVGITGGLLGESGFNLTVFNGQTKNDFINTAVVTGLPAVSTIINGTNDTETTQIESLLLLPPLSQSARFFVGATITMASTATTYNSAINSLGAFIDKPTAVARIESISYMPFVGIRTEAKLTDDAKHSVFANLQGMVGRVDIKAEDLASGHELKSSDWWGGVDTSVGYQYLLSSDLVLSARYRLIAEAPLEDWSARGNSISHGPELSITYQIE